jgi:FkbM family methyltransferase
VFLKREYGRIQKGDVVFDVGANVGSFALYAALSGAKKVYAFEPSVEAFQTLSKNIQVNRLETTIIPLNKAVSDRSGEIVKFPHKSSPFNSLVITAVRDSKLHVDRFMGDLRENVLAMAAQADCEFNEIATVTLQDFMAEHRIPFIDLLKMDCEGAEFSIVPSLTEETIDRIGRIRMECHGDPTALMNSFRNKAFMVEQIKGDDLWLVKRSELHLPNGNRFHGNVNATREI